MKKAFSLFEMLLVLVLLGAIFIIFSKPLLDMTRLYANSKLDNISSALIFIDKIAQNCLEFTPTTQGFECLLKDEANLILQRQNSLFIGSSGFIVKDENSSFYAPKSHFSYEIQNDKGRGIKVGVLENQKDLHNDKNKDFVYLYALKEKRIYKVKILDNEKVSFMDDEFSGFYEMLDAKIAVKINNNELIYEYSPYPQNISYTGILAQNIKAFELLGNDDEFVFKICSFDDLCLEKWVQR